MSILKLMFILVVLAASYAEALTLGSSMENLSKPLGSVSLGDKFCYEGRDFKTFYVYKVDHRKTYKLFNWPFGKDENHHEEGKFAALIALSSDAKSLSTQSLVSDLNDHSVLLSDSVDEEKILGKDQFWLRLNPDRLKVDWSVPTKERSSMISLANKSADCLTITKLTASVISDDENQRTKNAKVRLSIDLQDEAHVIEGIDIDLESFDTQNLLKNRRGHSKESENIRRLLTEKILSVLTIENFLLMASPLGNPALQIKNIAE